MTSYILKSYYKSPFPTNFNDTKNDGRDCLGNSDSTSLFIHHTRQISLRTIFGYFQPQEAFSWSLIRIQQRGNLRSPHIFQQSSSGLIRKDNQGKMAERMELRIANEGWCFKKVRTKNTDCELKDNDE